MRISSHTVRSELRLYQRARDVTVDHSRNQSGRSAAASQEPSASLSSLLPSPFIPNTSSHSSTSQTRPRQDHTAESEEQPQFLPLGVPPLSAPVSSQLSSPHQVAGQRQGRLQDRGQQSGLQTVGTSQEQARHELRDHG